MDNKLSELSKPVRIHRDWNSASMCHCGKCDRWEMTIADADGVQTCASCYDAEWLSEWQDYAKAAEKRIAELSRLLAHNIERAEAAEAKLATPVRLPEAHSTLFRQHIRSDYQSLQAFKADEVIAALRAAGFTVEGDE